MTNLGKCVMFVGEYNGGLVISTQYLDTLDLMPNTIYFKNDQLTLHMPELLGYHMASGSGSSPNGILVMLKDYSLTPIMVVKEVAYWKLDGYDNNAIMMLQYFDTDDSMENKDKWFVLNEDEHKMVDDYVSKGGMEYAIASCDKAPSFELTLHMPELLGYHMASGSGSSHNGILVMLKDYSLTPIVVVKETAYWKLDGYDNNAIMMLQYFDTDDSMENKDKWFVLNEDEHKMVDDYVSKGGMEYAIASCDKAPSFEVDARRAMAMTDWANLDQDLTTHMADHKLVNNTFDYGVFHIVSDCANLDQDLTTHMADPKLANNTFDYGVFHIVCVSWRDTRNGRECKWSSAPSASYVCWETRRNTEPIMITR
ncbi:hypothetical protein GUJ93_ZPchr0006g42322 [Zizania palustris]|uniref:Uncharacterized protein n=1 Tax=Zizania palustris TaxID=103762 RepID=A0A8J5T6D9_ZIZPA|nr:hypothetical protein GUJ93_ZPchr0006g42322 [Zizania palustris]